MYSESTNLPKPSIVAVRISSWSSSSPSFASINVVLVVGLCGFVSLRRPRAHEDNCRESLLSPSRPSSLLLYLLLSLTLTRSSSSSSSALGDPRRRKRRRGRRRRKKLLWARRGKATYHGPHRRGRRRPFVPCWPVRVVLAAGEGGGVAPACFSGGGPLRRRLSRRQLTAKHPSSSSSPFSRAAAGTKISLPSSRIPPRRTPEYPSDQTATGPFMLARGQRKREKEERGQARERGRFYDEGNQSANVVGAFLGFSSFPSFAPASAHPLLFLDPSEARKPPFPTAAADHTAAAAPAAAAAARRRSSPVG
jgi:hypothetical protein